MEHSPSCGACFAGVGQLCRGSTTRTERRPSTLLPFGRRLRKPSDLDAESVVSTEASESDGLVGASTEDLDAARELKAMVEADSALLAVVQRQRCGESVLSLCLRYAVARRRDCSKALEMLRKSMRYREEKGAIELMAGDARSALGGPRGPASPEAMQALQKQHGYGLLGYDRHGHVVVYRSYGSMQLGEFSKQYGLGAEDVCRHHHWLTEKSLQAIGHRGRWVQVIDLKGVSLSQCMDRQHLAFIRLLASLDSAHYPERLSQVYIINAPSFFASTFRIIRAWLDPKTQDRIQLLAGPSQWQEPLGKIIDLSILPRCLGGESELFVEKLAGPTATPSCSSRSVQSWSAASSTESPALLSPTPSSTWRSFSFRSSRSFTVTPCSHGGTLAGGMATPHEIKIEGPVQIEVLGNSNFVVAQRSRPELWLLLGLLLALCWRLLFGLECNSH